jgi:hypothetical protein
MATNQITESLPKNFLNLFDEEGNVKIQETQDFLEITRLELAELFGLTSDQLRPDRMGPKTKEKIAELAGALEFVAESFDGDTKKAKTWFKMPNLNFGGASPRELILRGKKNKVLQFILSSRS